MANKSITVTIGADTTQFIKGINKAQKSVDQTSKQIKELQKSLTLKWDNAKFAQAQKLAQEALAKTEASAEKVRDKLRQFESAGKTDTAEYVKLQTELIKLENKAELAQQRLEEINKLKFTRISESISKLGANVTKLGNSLRGVSLGATAAITGLAKLGIDAASAGAEIDDLSQRLGVSTRKIQEWQYVAVQTGIDFEYFQKGLVRARAALLDFSSGKTNEASKAIENLGLSMSDFANQEEMFDALLNALSKVEDKTLQMAYANEIFGDRIANQLIPSINAGEQELTKFREEFAQMNYFSDDQVKQLAKMDDSLYQMRTSVQYASYQLGAALIPIMQKVTSFVNDKVVPVVEKLTGWFDKLGASGQETVLKFLLITAALSPLLILSGKLMTGIGSLVKVFTTLNFATAKSALIFGTLGAALFEIGAIIANWGNMNTWQKVVAILGTLTTVALGAAIAFGAFQSALTLGVAAVGIAAGIAAVVAAVKSAQKDIEGSTGTSQTSLDYSNVQSEVDKAMKSSASGGGGSGNTTEIIQDNSVDNSTTNISIVNEAGDTAEDLVNKINQALKLQASSRS